MTFHYRKSTNQILTSSISVLILFLGISISLTSAFADDSQNDFIAITSDKISNDPMIAKILENMEKSKREFSDSQQKIDQEKIIEEQRNLANNILEKELERMFKENKNFTPLASFNKFLQTVSDDRTKTIFIGLFDYQQEKVNAARNAQLEVLKNGGTLQEARIAYYETAKIPRIDMIELVKDLNIASGFSDPNIQNHFSDEGKLPRYDDEETSSISFVNLSSSAKNINSSDIVSLDSTTSSNDDDAVSNDDDAVSNDVSSDNNIIQKLLEEIQKLKNKINTLEKTQNTSIQNVVVKQNEDDDMHYANWVSDYLKGSGDIRHGLTSVQTIPVNALNEPNSFKDINKSLTLGRQGQITLGFSEPVSDKLIVFEASSEKNIVESAVVEVSLDGKNWINLNKVQYHNDGSFVHEYSYDLSKIGCIEYVKITDTTVGEFADGFDIDALGATQMCTELT